MNNLFINLSIKLPVKTIKRAIKQGHYGFFFQFELIRPGFFILILIKPGYKCQYIYTTILKKKRFQLSGWLTLEMDNPTKLHLS